MEGRRHAEVQPSASFHLSSKRHPERTPLTGWQWGCCMGSTCSFGITWENVNAPFNYHGIFSRSQACPALTWILTVSQISTRQRGNVGDCVGGRGKPSRCFCVLEGVLGTP